MTPTMDEREKLYDQVATAGQALVDRAGVNTPVLIEPLAVARLHAACRKSAELAHQLVAAVAVEAERIRLIPGLDLIIAEKVLNQARAAWTLEGFIEPAMFNTGSAEDRAETAAARAPIKHSSEWWPEGFGAHWQRAVALAGVLGVNIDRGSVVLVVLALASSETARKYWSEFLEAE